MYIYNFIFSECRFSAPMATPYEAISDEEEEDDDDEFLDAYDEAFQEASEAQYVVQFIFLGRLF